MSRSSGLVVPLVLLNSQGGGGGGGTTTLANGGTGSSLVDPGADRIMFWDDSASAVDWLTAGSNLTITGTTISATGMTQFTAAESTSSPNGTVYVDSLTAAGSTTNVDAAFIPKGTGAVLAAIPDSGTAGGNKRGTNAVDLQTTRANANQVASGAGAVIPGGTNNRASGVNSFASNAGCWAGGIASVAMGNACTASDYCLAIGFSSLTAGAGPAYAIGTYAYAAGVNSLSLGYDCEASGNLSTATGDASTDRGLMGVYARGGSYRSTKGDRQLIESVQGKTTTDATETSLTYAGAAVSSTSVMVLPNNTTHQFSARVAAQTASAAISGGWEVRGTIKRVANAASTALVGITTITALGIDAGFATCVVDVKADTTNGACVIRVTGVAATTIQWTGLLSLIQVG